MEKELLNKLREFVSFIEETISEGKRNGAINEVEIDPEIFKWNITSFDYSLEKGVSSTKAEGRYGKKKQKLIVHEHNVEEIIKGSKKYEETLELLRDFEIDDAQIKLGSLVFKAVHMLLQGTRTCDNIVEQFMKEIKHEPIKVKAEVRLQGITLESDSIKISENVIIRKTKKEDLEKEISVDPVNLLMSHDYEMDSPSVIMNIEIFSIEPWQIQGYIKKIIALLRLYDVGEIKYTSYRLYSDAITKFIGGTFSSLNKDIVTQVYAVRDKDIEKLKTFWKIFERKLSENVFKSSAASLNDNINFAYQRYCEALASKIIFEQKIVNAITGLEALFLNNSQELGRFLRLRISKFLGFLGIDSYRIQDVIKEAYNVRSYFVHGNKLSYKQAKKLKKLFVNEDNFLKELLNFLRLSIVLITCLKKHKDQIIDMIDDSFIDKKIEEDLSKQINNINRELNLVNLKTIH